MAEHLDLVKNEWGAGFQVRLVTVENSPDQGLVLANINPGWEDILSRPLAVGAGDSPVYAIKEPPNEGLNAIIAFYRGDHVFATSVHSDEGCPFRHGSVVPMRPADVGLASRTSAQPA